MQVYKIRRTERRSYTLSIIANSKSEALARAQGGFIEDVMAKDGVTVEDTLDIMETELLSVETE